MRRRRLLALALAAACLTGCVGPSRTDDDYRHKVANSAQAIAGSVGTAELVLEALDKEQPPGPYLSVVLSQADSDASGVADQLDSVQPPSAAMDKLRTKADDLFQRVVSVLDELRIAVRRGELDRLAAIGRPLPRLAKELQQLVGIA